MAENNIQQGVVDSQDDRPLAVRRKRRISTGLRDRNQVPAVQNNEHETKEPALSARTPTKPKKRVRFSDPGLDASTVPSSSSTGLTPFLKRTSFLPRRPGSPASTPQFATGPRRSSFPAKLDASPQSPSLSPLSVPFSGEVQFKPLRQVLDARVKRRLRRNGLSEEVNGIEDRHKTESRLRHEVQELRDQLEAAKQLGNEEHSDNNVGRASSERVCELEHQLEEMNDQMRERSKTAQNPEEVMEAPTDLSEEINIFVDNTDDNFDAPNVDEGKVLRDAGSTKASTLAHEAGTQASLLSLAHSEAFREARLALEYLFPGEITLGLVPDDPKPLLETMVDRMRDLRAQFLIAEHSLTATQTQESNLRIQFNAVLAQLERARKHAETVSTNNANEKARSDTTQVRVQMLENTLQAAASKVKEWEKDADEKENSIHKLQDALETYRVEVGKLETLITKMEEDHAAALSSVRADMDEAVADLECHVVAETRGRREAEGEVAERDEKIQKLKRQDQELRDALNEKQQIIRETERIFEEERVGREREVGGLNVHIGQLSSELSESNAKVADAEDTQKLLMRKLQEERDAGLRAIEAVQADLARHEQNVQEAKAGLENDGQKRGAEVTQRQGLLTPVATRFKDVEGYVQMGRGKGKAKRRPDSGIVILEEDEFDEDTIMADDL